MFSKGKNQIKTTKTFSSVDNARYKKLLRKKAKTIKNFYAKSKAEHKTYKNMFETIKRKSKRKLLFPKNT